MPWQTSERVMVLRRRNALIDVGVDTLDGWRRHISGRNASTIAFFGFLSIFPLMLAATTILGFVLQGDEDLQQRILDGAFADIPVIGPQLAADPSSLDGSIVALLIGLGGALWSGTKAFVAIHMAQDDVWEVHVDDRVGMPHQRGKALLGMLIIGGAQIGTLAMATIVTAADLPLGGRALLIAATVAINIASVAAMFRYLTSADPTWRDVWPGAIPAGICHTLLQQFGPWIVARITANAQSTYGTFALVLGLVTWLSLLAITSLMSAELNGALVRRRDGSLRAVDPRRDRRSDRGESGRSAEANYDRPGCPTSDA